MDCRPVRPAQGNEILKRGAQAAAIFALLVSMGGCSRTPQSTKPEVQRIAILRFENLSSDSRADWMGRALSEILTAELSGVPGISVVTAGQLHALDRTLGTRPIGAPGISAERTNALASNANRVGYGDYSVNGSSLLARLTVEDARASKMTTVVSTSVSADDVLGAATALAQQISAKFTPYSTKSAECVKAFAEALESQNVSATAAALNRAITADPNFGPAYRMLAELHAQHGDRPGAVAVLDQAAARGEAIDKVERARIAEVSAELRSDASAKLKAQTEQAKLDPGNPRIWQSLAETAMTHHDYKQAADAYRHALDLEPENANLLNQFGYAATWSGDYDGGVAALRRYQQLKPKDPNAIDSLGDLNFISGHFREAEALYLQANQNNPNFLPTGPGGDLFKAAVARVMTGDLAGADELEKKFIAARTAAHDANAPLRELDWLWLTGRRKQAYEQLLALARSFEKDAHQPEASHAYAQVAFWSLIAGDRAAAAELSKKAAGLANNANATSAVIAAFLSQPSAPEAEWISRAARFVPNQAQQMVRDDMLAYALLLDGKIKEASASLRRVYDASGITTDEGLPVLIAWSELTGGNTAAAAELLKSNPVPPSGGVGTFMSLYFPRIFELRSQIAAKAGNADSAKQNLDLFHKLSGN